MITDSSIFTIRHSGATSNLNDSELLLKDLELCNLGLTGSWMTGRLRGNTLYSSTDLQVP